MNSGQAGWILLLFFALILIIMGAQGSLGLATAILFVPSKVELQE